MAANIIPFNRNTEPMARVVEGLQMIRDGVELLRQAREIEIQMCDGSTDTATHFVLFTAAGGFSSGGYADANAAAFASFLELDSLYAKLTKPSGQGDATGAAIAQACAKHGV